MRAELRTFILGSRPMSWLVGLTELTITHSGDLTVGHPQAKLFLPCPNVDRSFVRTLGFCSIWNVKCDVLPASTSAEDRVARNDRYPP